MKNARLPMFWVYENWTNTFTKVHRAECSFCNSGRGMHGAGSKTGSGEWHGPFGTARGALGVAERLASAHSNFSVWTVDGCKSCAPL